MHQVLYRLYRPKNFDEIYGQSHIIPILQNQIATGNVGHAYLFTGPRGTGKTSTARIFAKMLNNGSEMDIIELDAASHNKVEDIREIIDRLSLAPFEGKYKIYILDEVHMLTQAAANAFLKSLEEPPEHVIFIMATTEPHKLPATILSRTQRFDFNKITIDAIIERLKVVLAEEKISYEQDALDFIAQKSNGGLRDALSLLDKAISYGELNVENVTRALGSILSDFPPKLLLAMTSGDVIASIQILDEVQSEGVDPKVFLFDLIGVLRNLILAHNKIGDEVPEALATIDDKKAAYLIERISSILAQVKSSPNPEVQLLAEVVLLANSNFENLDSLRHIPAAVQTELTSQQMEIKSLYQKISQLENQLRQIQTGVISINASASAPANRSDNGGNLASQSNANTLQTNAAPRAELSPVEKIHLDETVLGEVQLDPAEQEKLAKLQEIMPQLKQRLKEERRISTHSVLMMAKPVRFVGGNLVYVFEGENRKMLPVMMKTEPNQFVDPILSELLGESVLTHYVTDEQFSSLDIDHWESLTKNIQEIFPGVPLSIE